MTRNGDPSMPEVMAVLLARDIVDGEKAIIGTNSDIQVAACNLARLMQAPGMWWISGPGGMTNPTRSDIISTADFDNVESAEGWMDLPNMIDFIDWKIHFFDFAILSALQVDRYGNINTVCVGDRARPKVRGPGTVGISALCGLARRFDVFIANHSRGSFVPRVDFLCGPGHMEGGDSRERRGLPPGGPRHVVSNLGVFDFEPVSKAMRIKSLHPGVTRDKVGDATGFELVVDGEPAVTRWPSADEMTLLRERVDSLGALRH
jgi:glutaconate CoA-transferase subunit B